MLAGAWGTAPEPLASVYLASEVLVELDGEWVDAARARRALGGTLWVLTAHNPGDARPGAAANDRADDALRAAIDEQGTRWRRAVGRAPDGSHHEAGFALVDVDEEVVGDLAARFGQVAYFVLEPGTFSVVATDRSWCRQRPHPG